MAAGYPLFYGDLGENLTTQGLNRRRMRPGQRYRAGQALLELTRVCEPSPRLEVYGLDLARAIYDQAVAQGDYTSPRWGLSGFYARVLEPGRIRQRAIISLVEQLA